MDISSDKQAKYHTSKLGHGKEIESLLIATQNNAIRTNYIEAKIEKTQENNKCRL